MKPHSKDRMIIIKAAVCLTLVGSAWALYAIGWRQHPMAGSWELVECRWRSPGGEIEVYRESDRITLCPTLFPDVYWLYGPKGLAGDTFWRIRQGQDVMLFESISAGEIIYSGLQLTKPNSRLGIAKLEKMYSLSAIRWTCQRLYANALSLSTLQRMIFHAFFWC
jgi:hypothetical protein